MNKLFQLFKFGKNTKDRGSSKRRCSSSTNSLDNDVSLNTTSSFDSTGCESVPSPLSTEPSQTAPKNPTRRDRVTSPSELLLEDATIDRNMQEDNIQEQPFYKQGSHDVRDGVRFLYNYGYGSEMTRDDRISKIETLVEGTNGNLKRLCSMVLRDEPKQKIFGEEAKESFLNLAVTVKLFFKDPDVFGEFKGDPFVRFQRGTNQTCWLPAACAWLSLLMRSKVDDTPDDYIVDLPQRIRRYISLSDKQLRDEIIERRVIDNKCDRDYNLARSFFEDGKKNLSDNWEILSSDVPGHWIEDQFLKYGPTLVINFHMADGFIKAAKTKKPTKQNVYGYWKFDYNVDDEGEFVPLNATEDEDILRNKLEETVLIEGGQEREKMNQDRAQTSSNANPSTEAQQRQPSAGKDWKAEAVHAMVLLGGKSMEVVDKYSGKKVKKHFFMCLNSWEAMPLVLLSEDYLKACRAAFVFRRKVTKEDQSGYAENRNHIAYDACSPFEAEYENFDGSSGMSSNWFYDMDNDDEEYYEVAAPPIGCGGELIW